MSFRIKKNILAISVLLLAILAYVLNIYLKSQALYIILPLFMGWVILYTAWWKCPHCKGSLGRLQFRVTHCKNCGAKISD